MTDPKVRFKKGDGCCYPAVQFAPLSEYLEVNIDRNKDHRYDKNDVLSVSGDYGVVNQIEFQGRSFAGADVGDYHILYTGDVVYTKSPLKENPYGIVKFNKGPTGIVSTLYAVYHCKKTADGRFIEYYFDLKSRLNNYLKPLVNIGAKHDMKISAEKAISGLVAFPCVEEQKKIADFLSSVDEVIAASEQEVANLETQKKVVMKKIFSQEVRFKREDGTDFPEWEEVIVKDIGTVVTGNTPPTKEEDNYGGTHLWVSPADIVANEYVNDTGKKLTDKGWKVARHLPAGSVLVTCIASIGKNSILAVEGSCNQQINAIIPNEKMIAHFILESINYKGHDLQLLGGNGGMKIVSKSLFEEFSLPCPCLEEQCLIADFLSDFDEAIAMAKKELELWKELKKGLLQQMFV